MAPCALSLFAVHLLLAASVRGQHSAYDYGINVAPAVRLVAEQRIVVGSLEQVNGTLPVRQEIRQLEKNQEQWTLYLLGLSMMQFLDQSEPLSWYQIAGIHGAPFKPWGGVEPTPENPNIGYCNHASPLFPTWHRPYLALFENMLYSTIQFVASLWPEGEDRARYQAAAATFRVPYWDWAATPPKGESVLPRSVWESSLVDVDGPNGVQRISNPLFAYGFKPLVPSDLIQPPWDLWQATFRAPTTDDASAESNNSLVARNLDQNLASIQQRLYTLFSNYANFSTFSNEGWIPNSPNASYDSLESLHDTIHSLAGGPLGGHMGLIPFSAFDPLFYLHHAMVDRIFAMWQALYPDSWVTPTPTRWGTYTIPPGETINSTTALTPFYADSDGTFWNSDTARNPHAFGYTYSEVVSLDLDGRPIDERAQSSLKLTINRLYGSSSPLSLVSDEDSSDEGGPASVEQGGGKADPASTIKPGKSVIVQNKYREWIANIRVERQALGGTFFIHFFLGSVPEDSGSWAHAPTLVGTMSVFASPGQLGMGQHDMDTRGTVPLTAALVHKAMAGVLPGLEAGVVQPYLERNLRFGVIGVNGTVVDDAEVLGLHIQIVSASVQVPPNDEELPIWGPMDTHFDLV